VRRLLRALTRRLAAALITAVAALLALLALLVLLMPGVSYAAGQSTAAARARSSPGLALDGCTGVTPAAFPAVGFITDPDRSQAGHLWWRPEADGVCIGTVVEFVQYNTTATKTWWVIVYSAGYPQGQVVGARTFSLGPGWYYFGFGVHQVFSGLSRVCITAGDSFGVSCIEIGQPQLGRFCVVGVAAGAAGSLPRPVRYPRPVQGRRRSTALAAFAMITANGGITSATAETTIAAVTEYRSSTAQDRTNNPMQTVMSTRYRRLSRRDGCGPDGCGPAGPSRSPPLSVASSSLLPEAPTRLAVPDCWLVETPTEHAHAARALSPSGCRWFTSLTGLAYIKAIFNSGQR
jgi:hypothetical protein